MSPKHQICELKLPFSQPNLILGDSQTTGRVHGGSVTVYQKLLNVYTRVHVHVAALLEGHEKSFYGEGSRKSFGVVKGHGKNSWRG